MLYQALLSFPNPDIYDMWIIAKPAPKNTHCSTGTISTKMQTDSSLQDWETDKMPKAVKRYGAPWHQIKKEMKPLHL